MNVPWSHLTKEQLDRQLSPSRSAKDFSGVLNRHVSTTGQALGSDHLRCFSNLRYGSAPAQQLDLILPQSATAVPCVVILHGGFWQEGDKSGSGFASDALAGAGVGTALVGYTLAPSKSLSEIVSEVADCIQYLHRNAATLGLDSNRLIVAGHSAGGYLAAKLITAASVQTDRVAGAVLISGVYDLAPIAASYVNDVVGITASEVAELSIHTHALAEDTPVHIVVGADEPEAFIAQSELLHSAWSKQSGTITFEQVAGCDHFDVLDELADTKSQSHRRILEMAQ